MPISDIQSRVLKLLAVNRNPENYLAGATVLHLADDTPRFSQDLDFFHDVADSVAQSAEQDAATLGEAGHVVTWLMQTPTFYRAVVNVEQQSLKMEWAQDSAFRFFPVVEDDLCGFRLHEADAATNKLLALAGRQEVRDYVDVLHLHDHFIHLGALAWAACGKDPGFTPELILGQTARHVAYSQKDVDRLQLREPQDITTMKKKWLEAFTSASDLCKKLPADDLGCLYLDSAGKSVTPDPASEGFGDLIRHRGTVRGAWPSVTAEE